MVNPKVKVSLRLIAEKATPPQASVVESQIQYVQMFKKVLTRMKLLPMLEDAVRYLTTPRTT